MSSTHVDRSTRKWETPTIKRIGTFGAVMRGGSRPLTDPGSAFRKVAMMV